MKRRHGFPFAGLSAALLVALGVLLVDACTPSKIALPQSPALKFLERKVGRIAYVGVDGNIHTMDQGGSGVKDVTSDASVDENGSNPSFFYLFPAWSRDARSLAFVSIRRTANVVEDTAVWTTPHDGAEPQRVYSSDERVARLLSWAPDSSRLVFVTGNGPGEKQLETVPAKGGEVRVLRSGAGFSWRWEARGPRIALHSVNTDTGTAVEQVAILDPQGVADEQDFPQQSLGAFDAPAWLADGYLIMAVSDTAGSGGASGSGSAVGATLYMEDSSGAPGRPLAHVQGPAVLDLSPDGRRLAWAASPSEGDTARRALFVMDLPPRAGASGVSRAARSVSGDDYVAAFFWSPDGSKIAYFVPSGDDQTIALKVLTVKTGAVRTVTSFTPSPFFQSVLEEFGQYSESVRLWSPDSRFLLYCAIQPDSFDVMVAYADQPIEPRKVADGLMATWSPE